MITLTPYEVKQRFGPLFSQKFLVMVDELRGRAEIIEQCQARGPIEWDATNRCRAGGAVTGCSVEETGMVIGADTGKFSLNFGASSGARTNRIRNILHRYRRKGRVGAPGAVLWANKGIKAAGFYGEHL